MSIDTGSTAFMLFAATLVMDTDLSLVFRQPPDKPAELSLTGKAELSGLQLREEGGAPLLNLQRLDVPLKAVTPLNNELRFGTIGIDGLEIFARKGRGGALNWLILADRLAAPAKPAPAKAASANAASTNAAPANAAPANATAANATAANAAPRPESKPVPKTEGQKAENAKSEKFTPLLLTLDGLRLGKAALRWQDGPSAQLERFELKGVRVDTTKRVAHVDEAGLSGLALAVTRLAGGDIAGLDALGAGNAAGTAAKPNKAVSRPKSKSVAAKQTKKTRTEAKSAAKAAAQTGWTVEVGKTEISAVALRLTDKSLRRPAEQNVEITKLTLGAFSTAPSSETVLNLALLLNKKGALNVSGPVRLAPLSAKLKVDLRGFELLPLQPYFADKVNLTVTKGQLTADGELNLGTARDGGLAGDFKGQLTLGGFHSVDKAASADFLTWKSLHLGRVNVNLKPLSVDIGEVALSDFYARLIVSEQGKLNVLGLVKTKKGEAGKGADSAATAAKPAPGASPPPATQAAAGPAQPAQPSVPVHIEKVTLQGGTVSFTDHFIKPNYSAKLGHIGGRVTGLSTDPASTASMRDLSGRQTMSASVGSSPLAAVSPPSTSMTVSPRGSLVMSWRGALSRMSLCVSASEVSLSTERWCT